MLPCMGFGLCVHGFTCGSPLLMRPTFPASRFRADTGELFVVPAILLQTASRPRFCRVRLVVERGKQTEVLMWRWSLGLLPMQHWLQVILTVASKRPSELVEHT